MTSRAAISFLSAGGPVTWVTVTFREELELLRLQAKSMAAFLSASDVDEILVVINDREETRTAALVEALRPDYGPHADRLRVIRGTEMFQWNVGPGGPAMLLRRIAMLHPWLALRTRGSAWHSFGGWAMQQVFKLLVSREVRSARMVLLDSKVHFLREVRMQEYFGRDGRPLLLCRDLSAARQDWLESSFAWFDLRPEDAGPRVASGLMPLPVHTALMRDVANAVEDRAGPLQILFAVRRRAETEAMLLNAYCIRIFGSLDIVFDTSLPEPAALRRSSNAEEIDAMIAKAEAGAPSFAFHRAAAPNLDEDQRARLRAVWTRAGLVEDDGHAARLLGLRSEGNPILAGEGAAA